MRNHAVEHDVAMFSELSLAVCSREGQIEASIVSNSTNLMSGW